MKTHTSMFALSLAAAAMLVTLNAKLSTSFAQSARFFRITGPAATRILALKPDGTLVWTNGQPGGVYIVQTCATLPGASNWVDYIQIPVTQNVNANQIIDFNPPAGMTLIPAGEFMIGDTLDTDTDATDVGGTFSYTNDPPTNVYVSAFYMDKNLISYGQWQAVYNWAITHGYDFSSPGDGKGPTYPVLNLMWWDYVKWCNARSEMEGLTPAYYTNAAQTAVYRSGFGMPLDNFCVKRNAGYRLPTEAEWEKAARGGLAGKRFPWGDRINEGQANYFGFPYSAEFGGFLYDDGPYGHNPIGAVGGYPMAPDTSPVGSFPPNGYGLYDMAGNATEACWDYYVPPPNFPAGSPYLGGTDPCGPNWDGGMGHVARGGSGDGGAFAARCANRWFEQNQTYQGCRCVVGPGGFGNAFDDDFSTGLNFAQWSVSQTTANLYSATASQGQVQLAKIAHNPGGTQNVSVHLNLAALCGPITNDFSVQIDFTNAVVPASGLGRVELRTYYQDGSFFFTGYEYTNGTPKVYTWQGVYLNPTAVTGNGGTFRICATGDRIYGFFNGGTALYFGSRRTAPLTDVTFVLQNDNGSDDAISVTFDNFSITSPSLLAH